MAMTLAPAASRRKPAASGRNPGVQLGALALTVVSVLACEGTKQSIFEALPKPNVGPPVGTAMQDAGAPPRMDAGHPAKPDAGTMDEDAGSELDPELDPTVTFVWTETLPGQGTCRAGVYAGSFDCEVPDAIGGLPFSLSGQIAFTLEGSPEDQHLSIKEDSGSISGPLFQSGMSGSLDCIQNHFQSAAVDGQAVSIGDMTNPFALVFPTFNASLQGDYDNQALVISGTFTMVNNVGDMCSGTFRVSAAP
jgi:hypothetical protein